MDRMDRIGDVRMGQGWREDRHPLMVRLSNHDSGSGGILRQAQDERKPKRPVALHKSRVWVRQVVGGG